MSPLIELENLKKEVHTKALFYRSVEAIVFSIRFERLWLDSTPEKRKEVLSYIREDKKADLVNWMKHHAALDYGEQPLSFLKLKARILRVKNYSRLSKGELISEILVKESEAEAYEQKK
jgi:hypothetical protein